MNNNDKLKKWIRDAKVRGENFFLDFSGTEIANASRTLLDQWLNDGGFSSAEILANWQDDSSEATTTATTTAKVETSQASQATQPPVDMAAAFQTLQSLFGQAPKIDMATLKAEVKAELAIELGLHPVRIAFEKVEMDGSKIEKIQIAHESFQDLLLMAQAKRNVWLVGPAGTGKTTAAEQIAEVLGMPFYFNGAVDTEYKLLGFTDAQGRIVSRPFREAYCNGGVYLFDEVDASMPSALLAFNAALANGQCDFPDGAQKRHKDFICIAAANTVGNGGTHEFSGRMKQDEAFLDRFVTLDWAIDERMERAVAMPLCDDKATAARWIAYVQKCRSNARKNGVQITISPRASMNGCALLQAGMGWDKVVDVAVRKNKPDAIWAKINA